MRQDDTERLARRIQQSSLSPSNPNWISMEERVSSARQLASHILCGDHKREIENAAFERAAKLIEEPIAGLEAQHASWRESFGKGCAQPYREEIQIREALAQTMRAIIQPPAQRENGE